MGGKKKLFNEEQEAFFIAHQKGLLLSESAELMNKTFGLQLTAQQVKEQRSRLGVTGGKFFIPHPSRRLLTPEQEAFFARHQEGLLRQEAADLMNRTFGLSLTALQVKDLRHRMKAFGGEVSLKGKMKGRNRALFRPGNRPHNYLPVGTELIKDDGYLWRKIAEPNKWRQIHILLWEEAYGKRKRNEKIIFLNGDRTDIRLDNLAKVSDRENAYLTTLHLRYQESELTRAGVNVARILAVCCEKKGRLS